MKLLIYEWSNYLQYDLYEVCNEKGVSYERISWRFSDKYRDVDFERWFAENITVAKFDALLSVNYYPVLAEVCHKNHLKYIAWCCDNPLNVRHIEDTLGYEGNYVFLFDRIQFQKYASRGFRTVYHMPLCVNSNRLRKLRVTSAEREHYTADVSFIGRLYPSALREIMAPLNEYSKGYLNGMMDIQSMIYGSFLLENEITDEFVADLNRQYKEINPNTEFVLDKDALLFAMASEVTRKNRLILMNLCGRRYRTHFYSMEDSEAIGAGVKKMGPLDYVTEMPQMFACSKINLNPTLRIIQTGIPLRALDIMGAGGFLLSNWQEELVERFENEKEMVVYSSYEDAIEKVGFYLQHEDLRQEIAANGREKTVEEYSMQRCLRRIFNCAGI